MQGDAAVCLVSCSGRFENIAFHSSDVSSLDISASGSDHAASKLLHPILPLDAEIEQANDSLSLLESELEPASRIRSEVASPIPREENRDTLCEDKVMAEGLEQESGKVNKQRRTKHPDEIGDHPCQSETGITPIRAARKEDGMEGQATGAAGCVPVLPRHQTPRKVPVDHIDGHKEEMRLSDVKAGSPQRMPLSKRYHAIRQDALADSASLPQQSPSVEENGHHPTPYKHQDLRPRFTKIQLVKAPLFYHRSLLPPRFGYPPSRTSRPPNIFSLAPSDCPRLFIQRVCTATSFSSLTQFFFSSPIAPTQQLQNPLPTFTAPRVTGTLVY